MIWWLITVVNVALNVPWREDEFVLLYFFMFPYFREEPEDPHLGSIRPSLVKNLIFVSTASLFQKDQV